MPKRKRSDALDPNDPGVEPLSSVSEWYTPGGDHQSYQPTTNMYHHHPHHDPYGSGGYGLEPSGPESWSGPSSAAGQSAYHHTSAMFVGGSSLEPPPPPPYLTGHHEYDNSGATGGPTGAPGGPGGLPSLPPMSTFGRPSANYDPNPDHSATGGMGGKVSLSSLHAAPPLYSSGGAGGPSSGTPGAESSYGSANSTGSVTPVSSPSTWSNRGPAPPPPPPGTYSSADPSSHQLHTMVSSNISLTIVQIKPF